MTRRAQGRSFRKEEMTGSMGISLPLQRIVAGSTKGLFYYKVTSFVLAFVFFSCSMDRQQLGYTASDTRPKRTEIIKQNNAIMFFSFLTNNVNV